MNQLSWRSVMSVALAALLSVPLPMISFAQEAPGAHKQPSTGGTTPIQHLVVIFQENVSFDHYFGTYPVATNPSKETQFVAAPGTPGVNGLSGLLLTGNPNLNSKNAAGATNPFRLDISQAATADQNHDYTPEQSAFDGGWKPSDFAKH